MGLSSLNPVGVGGAVDPKQFVPVTRTINGKSLSADVVLSLADLESKPGQSLEQFIAALEQKIAELELAIESGTTPEDLSPVIELVNQAKQAADAAQKVADEAKSGLVIVSQEIEKLKGATHVVNFDIPFNKDWVAFTVNGENNQIKRVGSMVNISVSAMYTGSEHQRTFLILPVELRPTYRRYFWMIINGESSRCLVDVDGSVSIVGTVEHRTQILAEFTYCL